MRITAELIPGHVTKDLELPEGPSGYDLFKTLNLAPDVHILARDDVPIPIDETLRDGDRLRVIAVVSGGGRRSRTRPMGISSSFDTERSFARRTRQTSTGHRSRRRGGGR